MSPQRTKTHNPSMTQYTLNNPETAHKPIQDNLMEAHTLRDTNTHHTRSNTITSTTKHNTTHKHYTNDYIDPNGKQVSFIMHNL